MKYILKQKILSWDTNYYLYNEQGENIFIIRGKANWNHKLKIYNIEGKELGMLYLSGSKLNSIYYICDENEKEIGCFEKKMKLFKPSYRIVYNSWVLDKNFKNIPYSIYDGTASLIGKIDIVPNMASTYEIDVPNEYNAVNVIMLIFAIELEKENNIRNITVDVDK